MKSVTKHTVIGGHVEKFTLLWNKFMFNKRRTIRVYVPDSYDASSKDPYDVIYLLDGQNLFDEATASYKKEWKVDETITSLVNSKERPMIVVGLDNSKDRISEYLPKFSSRAVSHYAYKGDITLAFLRNMVIPFIEKHYNVGIYRENRFFGGSSMGGLMALAAGIFTPDLFSGLFVFSPAFPLFKYGESESPDNIDGLGNDEAFRFVINSLSEESYINQFKLAICSGGTGIEYYYAKYARQLKTKLLKAGWDKNNILLMQNLNLVHDENQWAYFFPYALKFIKGENVEDILIKKN